MANSIGYLLSLNAYSTGSEATAELVSQGARVVYATTDTLSTSNLLYGDSRLTQPVFGLVGNYYGVQLLTNESVHYVVTFGENGAITFYTPTTTTTTVAPTTTTTAAPTTTTTTPPPTYTIGDLALGGVIAYINGGGSSGTSGLVATVADISTGASWGCSGTNITGADGTAIGTGNQNTIDIMAGCATAGIAARLCGDLVEGGYSDWYLPSKDELNALYTNQVAIGGFVEDFYWSSTESANLYAWYQDFSSGFQYYDLKLLTYYVRAIRSF